MKEAPCNKLPSSLTKTRSGSKTQPISRTHERGDKVVVNGAKESLLSILRKYQCQCTKHTLEKSTMKFLSANKVSASYDLVVWMFIFVRAHCEIELFNSIMQQYLTKMRRKQLEKETHQSPKYIRTKKETLKKFIESAQHLTLDDEMTFDAFAKSVQCLYSKGKSRDTALGKIMVYLSKVNYMEKGDMLAQGQCSFRMKDMPEKPCPQQLSTTHTLLDSQKVDDSLSSFSSQEQISLSGSHFAEKPTSETPQLPADQPNKSNRPTNNYSFDLFDELILDESDCSHLDSCLFSFQSQ